MVGTAASGTGRVGHEILGDDPVQPDESEEWEEEEDDDGGEKVKLRPEVVGLGETGVVDRPVNVAQSFVLRYCQHWAGKNKEGNKIMLF